MVVVADWSYSAQKLLPCLKLPRYHLSSAPGLFSSPGVDVSVEEGYYTPMMMLSATGHCFAHCCPSSSLQPPPSLPPGQTQPSSSWIQATQVYSAHPASTSFRPVER